MQNINVHEQYQLFQQALGSCGSFLLHCSDKEIAHCLFEEFDSDCVSFLHESVLKKLWDEKLISHEVFCLSLKLREKFRALENTDAWNVNAVKADLRWKDIFCLADQIKQFLTGDGKG